MAQVHERSPSPELASDSLLKRLKTTHSSSTMTVDQAPHFYTGLFSPENVQQLHQAYANNEPFKYAIIERLFRDDLLKNVKDECIKSLSFTERETDIYKASPLHHNSSSTCLSSIFSRLIRPGTLHLFRISLRPSSRFSQTSLPSEMVFTLWNSASSFRLSRGVDLSLGRNKTCLSTLIHRGATCLTTTM